MISRKNIQFREQITNYCAATFVISCVGLIFASMMFGEKGVAWTTALLLYPSLIVLLGNIGIADFQVLRNIYSKSIIPTSEKFVSVVFVIGRGSCFCLGAIIFIYLEVKILLNAL